MLQRVRLLRARQAAPRVARRVAAAAPRPSRSWRGATASGTPPEAAAALAARAKTFIGPLQSWSSSTNAATTRCRASLPFPSAPTLPQAPIQPRNPGLHPPLHLHSAYHCRAKQHHARGRHRRIVQLGDPDLSQIFPFPDIPQLHLRVLAETARLCIKIIILNTKSIRFHTEYISFHTILNAKFII